MLHHSNTANRSNKHDRGKQLEVKDSSSGTSVRENMIARKSLRFVALSSTTMRTVISMNAYCSCSEI